MIIMMRLIFMSIFAWICAVCGCKGQSATAFRSVDAAEFARVIADSAVVRLDVRTAEEFAAGHIAGAALVDVLQDDFLERARRVLPEGRTVALYCRSGRRSKKAAEMLSGAGFDVVELDSGWLGWTAAGFDAEE